MSRIIYLPLTWRQALLLDSLLEVEKSKFEDESLVAINAILNKLRDQMLM